MEFDSAELSFDALVRQVQSCRNCARMEGRRRVFSRLNGSVPATVLFVGEAPGRLGADRTGIPLTQDRTGKTFEMFLSTAGLAREDVFITNAVLCNPRDELGRNALPTSGEIRNCSQHLWASIEAVQPILIATLGRTALQALHVIHPHSIDLRKSVARPVPWREFTVFPLYHPGPRAMIHRNEEAQMGDYKILGSLVRSLTLTQTCASVIPWIPIADGIVAGYSVPAPP